MDRAVGLPFNLYTGTYETSVLTFEKRKKNWQCIKYYKHEPALKARLHDRKNWNGPDKKTNGSDKIRRVNGT